MGLYQVLWEVTLKVYLTILMMVVFSMPVKAIEKKKTKETQGVDKVGSVIHGFKLTKIEKVKEVNSTSRIFAHEKSGARLIYFSNDDDNKVFSIAFKTPPTNDTGVPHIMEHSVLCGSKNFPTKEPFVELMKGSLQTFVNAMTFNDKTVYPIASRNDKDFQNLMHVYLDAVFYPNLVNDPDILKQEGWHYEIKEDSGELFYNGVVYNEMKGMYSSPDSYLSRRTFSHLFPNGTYGNDAGGEPASIPNLDQNQFVAFYKKHYHPSNSYIFFYGNGDVAEHLKFLNDNYLKDFTKAKVDTDIKLQPAFAKAKEVSENYGIPQGDSEKDRTFLSLSYVAEPLTDGLNILQEILINSAEAPLKRALLDAEIGKDVQGEYDDDPYQSVFSITVKNSNPEMKEKFKSVVENTLKNLVKKGIDKKLIDASISKVEFFMREFDLKGMPKGIVYDFLVLQTWLYGKDPLKHIRFEQQLAKIRTQAKSRYFEKLIEKTFLKNNHQLLFVLKPKAGLDIEQAEALQKQLASTKNSLSVDALEDLKKGTERLKEKQRKPDTPENLAKIPVLELKDLNPKAEVIPRKEIDLEETKILFHDVFTNGITYINFYFDGATVPEDMIPYTTLLGAVYGQLDTEKYKYEDLDKEININTGGIHHDVKVVASKKTTNVYHPKFVVESKALTKKVPKLLALFSEMMLKTKFVNKKRIKELIQEEKARMEQEITSSGINFPVVRAQSYHSFADRYRDRTEGVLYYQFISDLEKNYDKKADEILANLKKIQNLIMTRHGLLLSLTVDGSSYKDVQKELSSFLKSFPAEKPEVQKYVFDVKTTNEAFVVPGKVQFDVASANYRELGFEYDGGLLVLQNILSTGYLWNKVRVQGGAYGGGLRLSRAGSLILYSYRDPNLKETFEIFSKIPKHLEDYEASDREMTKAVIGSISDLDTPLTPSMKGETDAAYFIAGITQDDIQKERDQVLKTDVKVIRDFAKLFEKSLDKGYVSVLGSESKINENKNMFGQVVKIIE